MRKIILSLLFCVIELHTGQNLIPRGEAMLPASSAQEQLHFSQIAGVQTLEYYDERRNRPVVVEFWYPIDRSHQGSDPVRDAPLGAADGKLPLILMSHGYRGSRLSQAWLAALLASQGYLVASVEHFGNTRQHFEPLLSLKFWDRARDISYALDGLLEQFRFLIDEERIGFIGYSLGGMTGLGLAGAQARNVRKVVLREYQNRQGFSQEALAKIDFAEGEKLYNDSRIKALLLLCPANFVYPPETLRRIKIPVGLVAGFYDEVLPHKEHAYPLICHLVPRKIKLIREKVSHSFLSGASHHLPNDAALCREVAAFSFDFFQSVLE